MNFPNPMLEQDGSQLFLFSKILIDELIQGRSLRVTPVYISSKIFQRDENNGAKQISLGKFISRLKIALSPLFRERMRMLSVIL